MYSDEFRQRYWKSVKKDTDSGCWEWIGQKDAYGYGVIKYHQKILKAHRIAISLVSGEIPRGNCVLHHCDNPGCVRPDHLYFGTQKENARDRSARGRSGDIRGKKNGRAKLSWQDVERIRDIFNRGGITKVKLGKMFGVTDVQIHNIILEKQWKGQ